MVLVLPNFSDPRRDSSFSCPSKDFVFSSFVRRAAIFVFEFFIFNFSFPIFSARLASASLTMSVTLATWSMPMNASTSGMSFGSSSRNRCGRQPETMTAWPRRFASRSATDSRIVSTLSSCAESMKEQVLTITASALAASLVISTPFFNSEPSMISASTRFLAQPSEIKPTRSGLELGFFLVTEKSGWVNRCGRPKIISWQHRRDGVRRDGIGGNRFHGVRRGVHRRDSFRRQAELRPQDRARRVGQAVLRVQHLIQHGPVEVVPRRQRDAHVALGTGGFTDIVRVYFFGEVLEAQITVVVALGHFVVRSRDHALDGGGHTFLRSLVNVNLHHGHGILIQRQIFRQRVRLVFDDRLVGIFFAQIVEPFLRLADAVVLVEKINGVAQKIPVRA